jgi:transcriptional regulator with XRE-family HTH domain
MPRVDAAKPQPLDCASSAAEESLRVQSAFGQRLRKMRHERLMTIEQLAELADLHPNYVGSIERGERNVSLFNIWRIADGLDVAASQLLEGLPRRAARRS